MEYGVYLPTDQLLPETDGTGRPRLRRIPAATLVLAHLLRHPRRIATGFGAAGFYGMTYFVDEEKLDILAPHGTAATGAPDHILLHVTRALDRHRENARTLGGDLDHLAVVDPGTALSHMMRTLSTADDARAARWQVPDLSTFRPGVTTDVIRCVQVSDALHQALGELSPTGPDVLRVPGGVAPDLGARVLGYTNVGAESPPETLLRLAVSDLAPGLCSQVPVFRSDGALLTVSDLAWEDHGLHLFYDGAHHLQRSQRDHDSEVLAEMQSRDLRVLRVTAGHLKDAESVATLRDRVIRALG